MFATLIGTAMILTAPPSVDPPRADLRDGGWVLPAGLAPTGLKVVRLTGDLADDAKRDGLAGTWSETDRRAVFTPRFPFVAGEKYGLFRSGSTTPSAVLEIPKPPAVRPSVTAVYPTVESVPENILRFYVTFDRPMSRGFAFRYVRILDHNGKPVEQPFLEQDDELWNDDQTRLTLLIDPGRIKKDVKPRDDLGPVFHAGRKYSMEIDGRYPDGRGNPLGNSTRRPLSISKPVETAPSLADWKLEPPARTDGALVLKFDRVMDHVLTLRYLSVQTPQGARIAGDAVLNGQDNRWEFKPKAGWKADGHYVLVIDSTIEDVSGNGLDRPFEIEIGKARPREGDRIRRLPFGVGK